MILNALHGDPLPVYGDGMQGAQLAVRRGLRARHRPRPRTRRAGRGLQRRRPRRGDQPRRRQGASSSSPAPTPASSSTSPTDPATTAATPSAPTRSARSAGRRASASPRASSTPSPGTATTPGGGSRSARASTARTTSASTAARWAEPPGSEALDLPAAPCRAGSVKVRDHVLLARLELHARGRRVVVRSRHLLTVMSNVSASLTAASTACGHVRPDWPIRPANDEASSCVQIFA